MRTLLITVAGLALGAAIAVGLHLSTQTPPQGSVRSTGQALVGGPFQLTDHTGASVTEQDYAGRYMLVMFGFTHCPDICPTELQVMAGALNALTPSEAEQLAPLFITIDPERDTAEALAEYVPAFDPRITALTGTPEQIRAAASAYRVYYAKVADEDAPDAYTLDHSAYLYLMDRDGRYLRHFRYGITATQLAAELRATLAAST